MKVFIVFGQTGEYSDHVDWPVKGFTDKARAESFEFECTKAAKVWKEERDRRRSDPDFDWSYVGGQQELKDEKAAVPGDPSFRCDYTGTDYYTVEVEVE